MRSNPDEAGLGHAGDTAGALAWFDALPAVPCAALTGRWRGEEVPTGHPLDGLLAAHGWWGKSFEGTETVHPLLFGTGREPVAIDPRFMPLGLALRRPGLARSGAARAGFRLLRAILRTSRARARLREVHHRGVVTAAMVYDHQPIIDVFRAVDADTLLGWMDLRGAQAPFFFLLRRER